MTESGVPDPYCYPGTRVLRNLLDVRDPAVLSEVETELTRVAMIRLDRQPIKGSYDLAHLCAIHQRIFGKVYPWAGQVRTLEIAKGSTQFMPHTLIPQAADYLFGQIRAQNHLRGLDQDQFVAAAAEHLANLNHLHPFREGNGRTQRAFFRQLAHDAGWHIAWERMDPKANIQASILSNVDPKTPRMREFLAPLVGSCR
jgi:cell filamentation protein